MQSLIPAPNEVAEKEISFSTFYSEQLSAKKSATAIGKKPLSSWLNRQEYELGLTVKRSRVSEASKELPYFTKTKTGQDLLQEKLNDQIKRLRPRRYNEHTLYL
jgi:hypothetical protein